MNRSQVPNEQDCAAIVRAHPFFNPWWYLSRRGGKDTVTDPATDYLCFGEPAGIPPGPDFDPHFYNYHYPAPKNAPSSALVRHALCDTPEARPTTQAQLERRITDLDHMANGAPPPNRPEISYCIPVMGRLDDLRGTLPFIMAEHAAMAGQVEFIVLSFDREAFVLDWLASQFPKQIASGLLRPLQSAALSSWHFGRAKNGFAPHVRGRMVSSLDADNFVTEAQTQALIALSHQTSGFCIVHHFSGQNGDGSSGRLTMPASVYRLTGYDNHLLPRQFDEMAAILRAMTRFVFLPFYRMAGVEDIFETSGAMAEFHHAHPLANARREVAFPPGPLPLNQRGPDYVRDDPMLHWGGIFNASQCRHALSRDPAYRGAMQSKSVWAGLELAKHCSPKQLAELLFDTVPSPATGLTLIAVLRGHPGFLPRFLETHRPLGISRFILIVPPDVDSATLPNLPPDVERVNCRCGTHATAGTLWAETAFRCAVAEGAWGLILETSELLGLPTDHPTLNSMIGALEETQRDRLYALVAHVMDEDSAHRPLIFRAKGKAPDAYAKIPAVFRDFRQRATISWQLDIRYHQEGVPGCVRRLVLMRHRQGVHLLEGRRSVALGDGLQTEDPWTPIKPQVALFDHSLRLTQAEASDQAAAVT